MIDFLGARSAALLVALTVFSAGCRGSGAQTPASSTPAAPGAPSSADANPRASASSSIAFSSTPDSSKNLTPSSHAEPALAPNDGANTQASSARAAQWPSALQANGAVTSGGSSVDVTQPPLAGHGSPLTAALGKDGTQVSGCLAQNDAEQTNVSRTASRGPQTEPAFHATAIGRTVLVTHDLSHACCLKSETRTQINANKIQITETLSGTACRCMCSSRLQTRATVAPGDYAVQLDLVYRGQTTTWKDDVHVSGALPVRP